MIVTVVFSDFGGSTNQESFEGNRIHVNTRDGMLIVEIVDGERKETRFSPYVKQSAHYAPGKWLRFYMNESKSENTP